MIARRLLPLLWLASLASAAELFNDSFDDNQHRWRLDSQWTLADGHLTAQGLPGQILVVGCEGPEVDDFRAELDVAQVDSTAANFGYGLLYRFDPKTRNGYFVAIGAEQGYGFGKVTDGKFELVAQARSKLVDRSPDKPLKVEVKGDRHTLWIDDVLVDVWRDDARASGTFGLLVVDAVRVEYDSLAIEALGSPESRRMGPEPPLAAEGSTELLSGGDLALLAEWRTHWNTMREAEGEPTLPARPDVVDLAVLALLKDYHITGQPAPATILSGWLQLGPLIDAGAVGPGAVAAVEFWLAYQSVERAPEEIGGREDLLAGLSWYQATRARLTAGWGDHGRTPLVITNALQARLEADRQRFVSSLNEAAREARREDWARLGDEVLARLPLLASLP